MTTASQRASPMTVVQGGVLAFLLLYLVATLALAALGQPDGNRGIELRMLAQAIGSLAVVGFAFAWPIDTPWSGRGQILATVGLYFAFLLAWVPISLVVVPAVWDALGWTIRAQPHLEYFTARPESAMFAVVLLAVCVVGPIAEEIIFRGYLQTGLARLIGAPGAVVVVGSVFGLVHVGSGWHLFVPLALMGMFFGLVRERSGGLAAPIVAHVLHNSLTVGVTVAAPRIFQELYAR